MINSPNNVYIGIALQRSAPQQGHKVIFSSQNPVSTRIQPIIPTSLSEQRGQQTSSPQPKSTPQPSTTTTYPRVT
jgi:hypothetical protein